MGGRKEMWILAKSTWTRPWGCKQALVLELHNHEYNVKQKISGVLSSSVEFCVGYLNLRIFCDISESKEKD